jgi:hypothetical protein
MVSNGSFTTDNHKAYFNIGTPFYRDKPGIIYGDLVGDGHEDAIVSAECGDYEANYSLREIFIYTMSNGKLKLITTIDDGRVKKDFAHYYPPPSSSSTNLNNLYWGIIGLDIKKGELDVHAFVDGCHACAHSTAIVQYKLRGDRLVLVGKPRKEKPANP